MCEWYSRRVLKVVVVIGPVDRVDNHDFPWSGRVAGPIQAGDEWAAPVDNSGVGCGRVVTIHRWKGVVPSYSVGFGLLRGVYPQAVHGWGWHGASPGQRLHRGGYPQLGKGWG
jgi:hypothetical protein